MQKLLVWIVVLGGLYMGYKAGWFDFITQYFSESAAKARQEQVIENEDGSITTVRYRNVFDLLLNK